jgi:hypothetical protein
VGIQAGLGVFFAAKLRAGVLFAIYQRSLSRRALDAAVAQYRRAREAWAGLARVAAPIYAADLSVSDKLSERGHWSDRLAAIDADIAAIARRDAFGPEPDAKADAAITAALGHPRRVPPPCTHRTPQAFTPGNDLTLDLSITRAEAVTGATCYYRHVNQAERFETMAMVKSGAGYRAVIPGAYTNSPYPLQYYFVVHAGPAVAHLYPGLGADHMQMPYYVIRRASAT